ncbi:MAG: hypothetical protein WBB82_09545 [Limnothrix sp.]
MSNPSKRRSPQTNKKIISTLVTSGLLVAGQFQLLPHVFALGTDAGETIRNTATATYDDPAGNNLTTTSNEVTVTVAEVAGITNVAQTPIDTNLGSVVSGDSVDFPFIITNTGNATTGIFVPSPDNVTTQNLNNVQILIDTNNDGTPEFTLNPGDSGQVIPNIPEDGSITVTIRGTVSGTTGQLVTAQLGNTGTNDSTNADSQNQPDIGTGGDAGGEPGDVRTSGGTPVNGQREAADTAAPLTIDTVAPSPLALATILKTAISVANQGTTTAGTNPFTDDVIRYGLTLRVENNTPANFGNFTPAPLEGTTLTNVDGSARTLILVSDAIPANTTFQSAVAPAGWRTIFTETALTTSAVNAAWVTTVPGGTITRVGFIYDPDNNLATASPSLPNNTTVGGFELFVTATGATGDTPANIFNLAQTFGETEGDPNNNVVYDESGDQRPNNSDDDGTPPDDSNGNPADDPYGDFDPNNDLGDPGTPVVGDQDATNNNTGTGPNGEPNPVNLGTPPTPTSSSLVNGPLDDADAVGPVNNNDDFINESIIEPVTRGVPIVDPAAVVFDNSVRNTASVAISNVVLRPISPANAAVVCGTCDYVEERIPDGTTITITQGGNSAVYTYNRGAAVANDTITLTTGPRIEIASIGVGVEIDYQVTIDLPGGSVTPALAAFSVPIVAYVNNDGNDAFDPATETTNNIKIDRLYTGFLDLLKEAQILPVGGAPTGFSETPPAASPGDVIQYRITYTNISTPAPAGGQSNVTLPATNVVIIENGLGTNTLTATNDWALDQDGDGVIDTQNVVSGTAATQGSIQYFNGNPVVLGTDRTGTTAAADVSQYTNTVGTVSPGNTGTFTFQRRVSGN